MAKQTEETKIKHQVKDYLRLKGWFVYHNLAGLGAYPGIPDLICIKDGITIYAEIKKSSGTQSENQIKFQKDIEFHGGYYHILRSLEDAVNLNRTYEIKNFYQQIKKLKFI